MYLMSISVSRFCRTNIITYSVIEPPKVEVPDGKSICPDPDERTTGVSCVQIYLVWKQGKSARKSGHKRTKGLMNARKSGHERTNSLVNARKSGYRHFPSGTVWTYRLSVWDGLDISTFRLGPQPGSLYNLIIGSKNL